MWNIASWGFWSNKIIEKFRENNKILWVICNIALLVYKDPVFLITSCDQSSTQLSIFFSDFLIAVGTPLFWLEMKTLAWFPIGSSELRSAKTILILTQVFFVHSKAGLCASAPCLWWWNGVLWFVKRIKLVLTFSFLGQGCLGFDLELKWRF